MYYQVDIILNFRCSYSIVGDYMLIFWPLSSFKRNNSLCICICLCLHKCGTCKYIGSDYVSLLIWHLLTVSHKNKHKTAPNSLPHAV